MKIATSLFHAFQSRLQDVCGVSPQKRVPSGSTCIIVAFAGVLSWIGIATSLAAAGGSGAAADPAPLRLPSEVPVIGAWFPQAIELANPEGYRDFLDAAAEHSPYTLLTTTMRDRNRQMVDADVHDWFKRATAYAKARGMGVVLELDVRHSVPAFMKQYPHALQQRLWLNESDLKREGTIVADITYRQEHGDAIHGPGAISVQLERVYTYLPSPKGAQAGTVKDITDTCKVQKVTESSLSVAIPCDAGTEGRRACVIARVTFNYPDVFSSELLQFEAATIKQYADAPLAGLLKDEWGFPADHAGNPHKNGFWTSRYREEDYAKRTGGRDLVKDSLLMCIGEEGREAERQAAINHYMEQSRYRNSQIEQAFYSETKATFGPKAFVGTHDTVFPYPDAREFERNGLNWWTATRDFGQSDEITPYSCRTSLAKKCGGPVWFNQWYSPDIGAYQRKIWSYALAGGRMNFHILFPLDKTYKDCGKDLLRSTLFRGDCRIRLLNNISAAPVDCPVAVVFGHANVMNWAGSSFEDIGTQLTDAFWRAGIYADLIPSSEIADKALRVDDRGEIWYGKQRYAAVVLYRPEFENRTTAEFFQQAEKGRTLLYRIGEWTKDFNSKPLDGRALLPARMKVVTDVDACARESIAKLTASGVEPQTPSSGDYPKWGGKGSTSIDMPAAGRSRLTDGTVILLAGEKDRTGDPIQQTLQINGHDVTFDAVGVAAVRLSKDGKLEAMAAGSLRHFKTGSVEITLDQPADVALWQDAKGTMQGVMQDYQGPVPASLEAITSHWLRVAVPAPLASGDADARGASASSSFDGAHGADKACDGILASDDVQNFWASANGQDVGAWWQTDLGQITNITEIQVQFRAFDGRYHFVPNTITFRLSDDGKDWRTVISKSADMPTNNSASSDKFYRYPINAKGRYVRLFFQDGTGDRVGNVKVVELVEVRVLKAASPGGDVK